ncbi:MAG TPA: alpha-ribazole phosphatase [Desulfotomaculum sp.]|nr:alpha-ribazole phosphatase [Desulfotomaculum sp.]
MGCRLYLVRHGETAWNAGLKFQGHTDVPLSQRGIEQAGSLARRLNNRKFTAFYASDLTRAIETAEIVAVPHGLAVKPVPALREVNFGSWEGLTFKEIKERFTELAQRWWNNPRDIPVPEGETLAELALRVNGAVRWILEHHLDGQEVVVVSHGGPIRIIIATMLGMDLNQYWRLRLDNACLNIIDFSSSDSGVLALFNDRSHLE